MNCYIKRAVDEEAHLSYTGQGSTKYIPIGEEVDLELGAAKEVEVEPKLIGYRTANYRFKAEKGNISGWDEIRDYRLTVSNHCSIPVKVEIRRNFPHQYWDLTKKGDFGRFEKVDLDTVKFVLELAPKTSKSFHYTVTVHYGDRKQGS